MPGTWYTSDPHIHHRLVAGIRGFASVDAHDSEIIRRWNKAVAPEDTVWVLGDVGMGDEDAYLGLASCLNGIKHLISGNHDAVWPGHRDAHKKMDLWLAVFATIQPFARRKINGHEVLLSHFPYAGAGGDHTAEDRFVQYRLPDQGRWLLHGHTHGPEQLHDGHQIHVGLDAWDLKPVNEGMIGKLIAGRTCPFCIRVAHTAYLRLDLSKRLGGGAPHARSRVRWCLQQPASEGPRGARQSPRRVRRRGGGPRGEPGRAGTGEAATPGHAPLVRQPVLPPLPGPDPPAAGRT